MSKCILSNEYVKMGRPCGVDNDIGNDCEHHECTNVSCYCLRPFVMITGVEL